MCNFINSNLSINLRLNQQKCDLNFPEISATTKAFKHALWSDVRFHLISNQLLLIYIVGNYMNLRSQKKLFFQGGFVPQGLQNLPPNNSRSYRLSLYEVYNFLFINFGYNDEI